MKLDMTLSIALTAFALLSAGQAQAGNILPLTGAQTSASTIPPNGDLNPYGVAFVPAGFPAVKGGLVPGDILVSNFNNKQNLQGTGTTIVRVPKSGAPSVFFAGHPETGLSTALAVLKEGFVLVGNFPAPDGTINTAQVGSLIILDTHGRVVETLGFPMIKGPWDMTVYENGGYASAYVSNALTGTVNRLDFVLGEEPLGIDLVAQTEIAEGYAHKGDPAAFVDAPTGSAYDPNSDTLYVASSLDNAVYAIEHAGDRTTAVNKGELVYKDNTHLHGALTLALAPNGHLLVTNNDAVNSDPKQPSEVVEFTKTGHFVAQFSTDKAQAGPFEIAIEATGAHSGRFALVDDLTNTLRVWRVSF